MYQGVCTHTDQERRVVRAWLMDPKQNPDNICDVREEVLKLIKGPDIYSLNSYSPERCGIVLYKL